MHAPASDDDDAQKSSWRSVAALALLVPVPTIAVCFAMHVDATRGTALGTTIYAVAKVWILALPLVWLLAIEGRRVGLSPMRRGGVVAGVLSGLVIAAAIAGAYLLFGDLADRQSVRAAALRNGIGTPAKYLLFAAALTIGNALLEEYVWRWFVYRQCERLMPAGLAVAASAAMFTLHHVVALTAQTTWTATLLASAGLFIGACFWSWLYQRYRSIWPGYISHVFADIAVFGVGWMLIFGPAD